MSNLVSDLILFASPLWMTAGTLAVIHLTPRRWWVQ